MRNKQLERIVNRMIVDTILSDPLIVRTADEDMGMMPDKSDVTSKVENYFKNKFSNFKNSDDKLAVITEFLTPAIIWSVFGPTAAIISKVLEGIFHFNIGEILSHMVSSLTRMVSGGKKLTSEDAQQIATSAVISNMPPDPNENTVAQMQALNKSSKLTFREAQILKIAMEDYFRRNPKIDLSRKVNIKFAAGFIGTMLEKAFSIKNMGAKVLITVLGWVLDAALIAGGFMIAGDVVNNFLENDSSEKEEPVSIHDSIQTKFKVNPEYVETQNNTPMTHWIVPVSPNDISDVLINWAKEIYPGLAGHESEIKSATTFQDTFNILKKYNKGASGNLTVIPQTFKTTKQIVDQFIDEVALHIESTTDQKAPGNSSLAPHSNLKPAVSL